MRLVSCYINGFGQIKEASYDFKQDFNAFCEENGWGKTTFTVFIKAMFYGMEYNSRVRSLTERKHYLPWDGTKCGGNLVFEVGDKTYRVERFFGQKDKEDTFALVDVVTGKASSDYSENLGEELFQVDRNSFEKSVFIPQMSLATSMTDSLNAKMGDLASVKNDINNFDAALSRVVEARKNYTRKSEVNTGKLQLVKTELQKCNELIDTKNAVLDGYQKQSLLLEEKKKNLNWLEAEKNRVAELIRQQSKKEQDMGAYRQQVEFLTKQQETLATLDDFFANGVPELSEQEAMEDIERQYDVSKRTETDLAMKLPTQQQVQKWENMFEQGTPSAVDLEDWNKKATYMQELKLQGKHSQLSEEASKQLGELRYFFAKKTPTQEELSQVERDVVEMSKMEGRMVELDEAYRNLKAKKEQMDRSAREEGAQGSVILFFCLFAVLLAGGIAFRVLLPENPTMVIFQIVCFGAAAALFVAGMMQHIRIKSSRKNRREDLEQQLVEAKEALEQCGSSQQEISDRIKKFLSHFMLTPTEQVQKMVYEIRVNLDKYERLLAEEQQATESTTDKVEEMADVRMELYTLLERFAQIYHMDLYNDGCEIELLEQLKKDVAAYEEYRVNRTQMDLLRITMNKQKELLHQYVGRFPQMEEMKAGEALKQIRSNMERYHRIQQEVSKLQEEMKAFKDEAQVEEEVLSVEQLQENQEKLDAEMKELHQGITQDRESIIALGEELDAIEEAESKREILLEQRGEYQRKVDLLLKTEEYLQIAKEQFLSKYMEPLRRGMDHYMGLLDEKYKGDSQELDFDITMDLSVQVLCKGATYSSEYLSCGYQDLVALCARFALVDVLYPKEKPMVILDDPFTNLDEEKTKRGMSLLQEISKERQILYFTCHESRMI